MVDLGTVQAGILELGYDVKLTRLNVNQMPMDASVTPGFTLDYAAEAEKTCHIENSQS